MLRRLLIASLGGAAITLGMLFGMNEVAELFTQRSPDLYYRVMDYIPGTGPRRPRLVLPETQPDRPRLEYGRDDRVLIEAAPEFNEPPEAAAPSLRLDAPTELPADAR